MKSRKFHNLLAGCEQIVGQELSKNIPMAIGLDLYIAECSGKSLRFEDLLESVGAARSTFGRYVRILESKGIVERLDDTGSNDNLLRLTQEAQSQFQSIFSGEDI